MKIINRFTLIILLVVLQAGCTSTPQKSTFWEKPGATAQDFEMDRARCNAQAFSIPNAPLMQVAIVQNQCLRGKGWYLVER